MSDWPVNPLLNLPGNDTALATTGDIKSPYLSPPRSSQANVGGPNRRAAIKIGNERPGVEIVVRSASSLASDLMYAPMVGIPMARSTTIVGP